MKFTYRSKSAALHKKTAIREMKRKTENDKNEGRMAKGHKNWGDFF